MAKFQVGDKVRDRYTGAEGTVTIYTEGANEEPAIVTVEWIDALNRIEIRTFDAPRLLLVETAAAAGEGERVDRRRVDAPERELRITAPAPSDGETAWIEGCNDPVVVDVSGDEPTLVGADQVDEEERERRDPIAPEDIQTHTVKPTVDDADAEPSE